MSLLHLRSVLIMRYFKFASLIFIIFFIFLFLLYFSYRQNKEASLSQKIARIAENDRYKIEIFFRILLLREGGAYVLFGDKPVTISGYSLRPNDGNVCMPLRRNAFKLNWSLKVGLESWKKYAHLFPSRRFVIKDTTDEEDPHTILIDFINKESFITIIQSHQNDFKHVLGKLEPGDFLEKYIKENKDIFIQLKRHEALLGTLLGYGRNNAWLFHERARTYYDPYWFTLLVNPKPGKGFCSIEEERRYYAEKMQGFPPHWRLNSLRMLEMPGFTADLDSQETLHLLESYQMQRNKIHKIYENGNFLEETLKQYMSYQSGPGNLILFDQKNFCG